jgi:polar amino acid transport system permease protein
MRDFTLWQILGLLLSATRWTLSLTLIAFVCGGLVGMLITVLRIAPFKPLNRLAMGYIQLFQSTPLLMQLFLAFFGLPILFGVELSAWAAATIALTGFASAFLAEIWRGCLQSIAVGQWETAKALGLRFIPTLALIIVPQAVRLAIPPTVGFSVQVVKGTALASIIGFIELTKTGVSLNNVTFRPFLVFSLLSFIYFSICFPLSWLSRRLERRLL